MFLTGNCPMCEALIVPLGEVGESEILMCPDCQSELEVKCVRNNCLVLDQSNEREEYWEE